MIKQMSFLGLVVDDINSATAFYRDVLGLAVDQQETIPDVYTQFKTEGGATFGLVTGFEKEDVGQRFDSVLEVADVDEVYERWVAAGVEMVTPPTDMPFGRTFLFKTPQGHILRAMSMPAA